MTEGEQSAVRRRPALRILALRHRDASRGAYGGPVYTDAILRLLAHEPLSAQVEQLVFEQPPEPLVDRLLKLWAALNSLVSALPAKALRFRSWSFRRRLHRTLERHRFDLVLVNGVDMLWCHALLAGRVPVVYLCHNLEADLYRQQIERFAGIPLLGRLVSRDAAKLAALERQGVQNSDVVIAIAPVVAERVAALAPRVPRIVVPPSFSQPRYCGDSLDPESADGPVRLAFLGNLRWWPNRSAVDWFLTEVWPMLADGYELHLFGSGSDQMPRRLRVVGHGYVPDLALVWRTAQIMIHPIIVRAGLNIKVAEAIYHRRPMIATTLAVEGCGLAADPAIVIADGPAAWIDFLAGPEPLALRRRIISRANAERFADAANAESLARFVRPLIGADRSPETPGQPALPPRRP